MTTLRDIQPGLLFKTKIGYLNIYTGDENGEHFAGDVLCPGEHFLVISLLEVGKNMVWIKVLTPRASGYIGIYQWTLDGVDLVTPTT